MSRKRKVPSGTQFQNDAGQIYIIDLSGWESIADSHSLEASRTIYRHLAERDRWFVLSREPGSKGLLAFSAIKTGERSIPRGHYLDTDKAVDWLFRYGKEHAIPEDIDLSWRVDAVRENVTPVTPTASSAELTSPKLMRNLTWYAWYHDKESDEHRSHAKIRDRWNRENRSGRVDLDKSDHGRGVVKQGIAAAARYLAKHGIDAKAALEQLRGKK